MSRQLNAEYGLRGEIIGRWLCRYNGGCNSRYPCRHKGCLNKLRNGRCGLDMARLEVDEYRNLTGKCLDIRLSV
jgi:hypothetical protein